MYIYSCIYLHVSLYMYLQHARTHTDQSAHMCYGQGGSALQVVRNTDTATDTDIDTDAGTNRQDTDTTTDTDKDTNTKTDTNTGAGTERQTDTPDACYEPGGSALQAAQTREVLNVLGVQAAHA